MWSKWALESITMSKASGGDGIPVELFQILKDDAVKVLHSICQQIWKTQQWPQDWKRSVFIPIPKKVNARECSNYRIIAVISHASKVMLKILQARLQQYAWWKWKRRVKSWLKAQHSENEDHGIWSHHFMGTRWGNSGNSVRLYFLGVPKSLQMVAAAMKLKDTCYLEEKLWQT